MKPDYYHILGVAKSADDVAIKRAFRSLAKQYHPDLNPAPGATEQFMQLNEAYEILSNPQKRLVYDLSRRSPTSGPSPRSTQNPQQREAQYQDWVSQAQRRAHEYAQMNYQQFQKSRFEMAEARVFFYLQFMLLGVMFLIGTFILTLPVMMCLLVDWRAIALSVAFLPISIKIFQVGKETWIDLRSRV